MRIWFGAAAMITIGAAATFLIVFRLGLVPAIVTWEAEIGTATAVRLQGEIERMLRFQRALEEDDLREYIGPYVEEDEFLIVFEPSGERLYAKVGGNEFRRFSPDVSVAAEIPRRVNGVEVDPAATDLYTTFREADLLRPLEAGEEPYGYIAAGTTGFAYSAANRHMYRSLVTALTVAIALTTVAAVTIVSLLSRHLNRGVTRLISRLRRTADGTDHEPDQEPEPTLSTGITELDGLDHEIGRLQRHIGEERRVRRNWAMDIAHDLRTPVTALRAQLEAVRDGVFQPDPSRIAVLLDHVANLDALVQAFLLLTRVESPDYRPQTTAVEGTTLVTTIVDGYRDRFRLAGHRVAVDVPPSLPLEADAELIRRALANLLDNAVTHGTPGLTTVTCAPVDQRDTPVIPSGTVGTRAALAQEASAYPGVIRITVRNAGSIDPAVQGVLFDRFARSRSNGHGLGLALVAAIAEAHRGRPVSFTGTDTVEIGFEIPAGRTRMPTPAPPQQRAPGSPGES
jgi:signal transduction histidine kinase